MLAYQHAYHAGNFADVHKHLALHAVTRHLLRKESPVTYVDTHAGRGLYPLAAMETDRLQEYRDGVEPVWAARHALARDDAPLLADWLAALTEAQPRSGTLTHYPGSPWWLSRAIRQQDRLTLFELHPGEHRHLESQALPPQARRFHEDGPQGLMRRLPVPTPRLCVLIDPSYERKAEYAETAQTLQRIAAKARHAVVMIWYPLLPAGHHHGLLEALRTAGIDKLWRSELVHHAAGERHGMYGSGLVVRNPPWGLDTELSAAMQRLAPLWGRGARHSGKWWTTE